MTVSPAAVGGVVGCPWCHHRFHAEPETTKNQPADPDVTSRAPLAVPPTAAPSREEAATPSKASGTEHPAAPRGSVKPATSSRWKPVDDSGQDLPFPPPPPKVADPPAAVKKESRTAASPDRSKAVGPSAKSATTSEAAREKDRKPEAAGSAPDVPPTGGIRGKPTGSGATRPQAAAATPEPPRKKAVMKILSEPAEPTWTLAADGSLPTLHLQESQTQDQSSRQRSANPLLLFVVLCSSMIVSLVLVFMEPDSGDGGDSATSNAARRVLIDEYIPSLNPETPPADYQILLREAQRARNSGDLKREKELYRRVLLLLYAHRDRAPYEGLTGSAARDRKLEEQLRILLRE